MTGPSGKAVYVLKQASCDHYLQYAVLLDQLLSNSGSAKPCLGSAVLLTELLSLAPKLSPAVLLIVAGRLQTIIQSLAASFGACKAALPKVIDKCHQSLRVVLTACSRQRCAGTGATLSQNMNLEATDADINEASLISSKTFMFLGVGPGKASARELDAATDPNAAVLLCLFRLQP